MGLVMGLALDDAVAIAIAEPSRIGEARRLAQALAERSHFKDVAAGQLAIVVTELATNLVKHAAGGWLNLRAVAGGIEVLALDRGPGMDDVPRCVGDGFSTAGSPGTGLGAVRRQSALFDVCSIVGTGTAVLAVVASNAGSGNGATLWELGAVSVAKPGQDRCGDRWVMAEDHGRVSLLLVDGLGHGLPAAEAADEAVATFAATPGLPPVAMIEKIHVALRATRGAAALVVDIDPAQAVARVCGVGNVCAVVLSDGPPRHVVSHSGILGHEARRIVEFTYPWAARATLVIHSDGIAMHWDLDRYPGLLARHPGLVAGVVFRDWNRGRDDAAVLVARLREPAP
jgi:anti-sigma regulatory factor (Ser/Thr protein kinase)